MMRTAFGLMTFLSLGLCLGACSSKSVDDDDGKAGSANGGTSAGTASTGGSNGNTSGAGGVVGQSGSSSTAGTGGSAGGTTGGSTTGGASAGDCVDDTVTCVDAATASVCDPLTGEVQTANCTEELAKDGLISNGCTMDATGSGCTVDDLADAECEAGTPAFAVCAEATEDQLIDIYVACFHNNEDIAHEAISCYADYADAEAGTVDCEAADAACLPATE